MFDFDQYLGFLAFLTILTIGFWLMIFLLTFVIPYWVGGSFIEFSKDHIIHIELELKNGNELSKVRTEWSEKISESKYECVNKNLNL